MLDEIKKQFTSLHILITLLIIAVGIYVFQILWQILGTFSDVIAILLSAWLISFILEPLVFRLTKLAKMPKIIATTIIYLLFFGFFAIVIFLFLPAVTKQLQTFFVNFPIYLETAPPYLQKWLGSFNVSLANSLPILPSVAQFLLDFFVTFIISFYFVLDKERIHKEFYAMLPKKWREQTKYAHQLVDTTFKSFVRMQIVFGIICGLATWIILRLFNVDFAAATSLLAGIFTIIPLIGPVLALIPPILIILLIDPTKALLVGALLVAMQLIVFNIIGPKMMGRAFKLHPIVIILSFFVGYKIAGGFGAILAIPIFSIVAVLIHQFGTHLLNPAEK